MNAATMDHPGTIVIEGPEPLVIDPTRKRAGVLTSDEARLLTHEIQRTTVRLWILVTEAHDRKAHMALGYDTWDDYVRAELKMSPSRSYQLLDTGHVVKEMAAAGADIDTLEVPPARVVARVKDRLPEIRSYVRKAIKDHESPDKALRELAKEPRRGTVPAQAGPPAAETDGGEGEERPARGRGPVTCPACKGSGKVTRQLAPKLRAFLKRERDG